MECLIGKITWDQIMDHSCFIAKITNLYYEKGFNLIVVHKSLWHISSFGPLDTLWASYKWILKEVLSSFLSITLWAWDDWIHDVYKLSLGNPSESNLETLHYSLLSCSFFLFQSLSLWRNSKVCKEVGKYTVLTVITN